MFCEYQKVNVNSSKEGSAKDQMFVEVKFEETVEELSADGRTDQLVSCVDVEDVDGSAAERDKTISLSNDYSCRDSTNARRLLEIEHCKTFYTTLGDSKSSVALQYASGLGSYEFAVDEIQTMHSETIGEVVKEDSIAIPSKVSSVHNLCFGNDGDIVSSVKSFVSKRKSSSLSCLPDRIYFLESPSFTLPPRLSSVKAFNPNLGEGRSDHTCYDTAESVSSSSEESSKEEDLVEKFDKVTTHDSYREDQESSGEHTKELTEQEQKNDITDLREAVPEQDIDLSTINTETRTFVRSSALDILSKFPKTETVSSVERKSDHSRIAETSEDQTEPSNLELTGEDKSSAILNVVSETIREMEERSSRGSCDHSEPRHIKSQRTLGGEGDEHGGCTADYKHQEVIPWSSSVETKRKKKRILKGKKRDMYEVSKISDELGGREDQTDVHKDTEIGKRNSTDAGSAPRQTDKGKKKKQKLSSSAWMNFFRGKSDTKEEALKQEKPRKERKPLQKSQSFHSGSTPSPRSNQLNRMDSFRKLFKRPRDAASTSECLGEGKPAERKTCLEISSPIVKPGFRSNILVDREVFLAQKDRSPHLEKDRLKGDKKKGEIDVDNPDSTEARRGSNSGGPLKNGSFNISGSEPAPPVAPIRRKHLERKRLSRAGEEGLLKWTDDNGAVESILEKHSKLGAKNQCDKYSEYASNNQNGNFINMVVGEPSEKLEPLESAAESCLERTKPGDNARETDVILHHEPKLSDLKSNNDDLAIAHDLSPTGQVGVGESQTSQSPRGVYENGGTEENYEDVFHDCEDNTKLSFDSATVAEKDGEMRTVSTIANSHDSSRRWQSDVSSSESKTAIETAKKKTSQSFSGGRSTSSESSEISTINRNNSERTSQQKRMSIFGRVPSVKLEQSEPPTMVTDLVPTTFSTISTDRRSQIVLELFTTERTYVRGLETMIELFKKPMLASKVDEKEVDWLFSNINDIFAVNKDLLFLLWEKVKHWGDDQCIGQIFIDMEERFKIYAIYCKNFDKADTAFKQKIKRNKDFDRFLKTCYQDPLCQPGLDLPAYLITIVQRIPRYLLLLKDLCKKTPPSHPDYHNLNQALSRMNKVAEYINSQLQEVHGQKAMQELRSTVIGLKAYEVKGRNLLKEAEVCLMSPKKPYKCLLFNDIMVFAVQGSKDRSEIEMTLELRTLWFEDLKKNDPQTNKCDAIELYTPHRPYTMYASTRTEKRIWLQKLRTAIVTLLYGPDCEDPDAVNISRRKASDTYIDGSVYCGEYVNGKRHGQGVMAWPNRTRYEGSWADDERHGHGQLTYYTGEKYVGNWVADKKDGEGRQTYVNGDVYKGQWSEGKMHGKGVIEFANGDRFEGDMLNNEVEGDGQMTCISGLVYKGEWKKSKRHGQGHLFFPNGDEYIGEMLNDRICGYGRMTYFNGDEYTGEWVNEMRHGIGYFKLVRGAVYDGQWNNDFMNGQGKMSYPNGDDYTGTWYQNKRVGKGQLMYANGDTYNGLWQEDTMHGKGVMYYKDGSVYEGNWERGERHGHGKIIYKDKSSYEGEFYRGFRHGRGKLIYANNVCYVGDWKSDKFDGNGVFSDPNTEYSYQGDWSYGRREGIGIEIYYKTRYEGNWKADMRHGTGTEKSHAGHTFEGTWKDDRKHGKGVRTLRSGVREDQEWHEGHLLDIAETVAEDLPRLPRR